MKRTTKAHEKAGVLPDLPRPQFRQQFPYLSLDERLAALLVDIGMTQRFLADGEYKEVSTPEEAGTFQRNLQTIKTDLERLRATL